MSTLTYFATVKSFTFVPCMLFVSCQISLEYLLFNPFFVTLSATQWVVAIYALSSFFWCLALLSLLCCFCCFIVLLHFIGRLLFLSFSYPFSESNRLDWEQFWDLFSVNQFEFYKSIGEVTIDWCKISDSIGEVAVYQFKSIFDDSHVNIEAVYWCFVSTKGGRTIVWFCTSSRNFLFDAEHAFEEYNIWTQFQSNPPTSYPASFWTLW